jgi:hypothetical protein
VADILLHYLLLRCMLTKTCAPTMSLYTSLNPSSPHTAPLILSLSPADTPAYRLWKVLQLSAQQNRQTTKPDPPPPLPWMYSSSANLFPYIISHRRSRSTPPARPQSFLSKATGLSYCTERKGAPSAPRTSTKMLEMWYK